MSKVALSSNALGTGTFTIASPNGNTDRTLTLPDNTGTLVTQNSQPAFASTIGVGGATPSASGAGITFPATQSASTDANTLDDYEEGTWTPSLVSTGNSWTYSAQGGYYVKIGKQVICQFNIITGSRSGSSATSLFIAGLPYAIAAGTSYPAQIVIGYAVGPTAAFVSGYGYTGQTQAVISKLSGVSVLDAVGTELSGGQLIGQVIYTSA
jgi:hypothetical protein